MHIVVTVTMSLSQLELELIGLQLSDICSSAHQCLEHLLSFRAVPLSVRYILVKIISLNPT